LHADPNHSVATNATQAANRLSLTSLSNFISFLCLCTRQFGSNDRRMLFRPGWPTLSRCTNQKPRLPHPCAFCKGGQGNVPHPAVDQEVVLPTYTFVRLGVDRFATHPCPERKGGAPSTEKGSGRKTGKCGSPRPRKQ
jgi:hypothetical protein